LPARFEVDAATLSVEVDDRDAAYPIVVDPLVWRDRQHLFATEAAGPMRFGRAVAVSGDRAAVSAPGTNHAITIYTRDGLHWVKETEVGIDTALDAVAGFGVAIALTDDVLAVGAPLGDGIDGTGPNGSGAVWIFERTETGWGAPTILPAAGA